MKQQWFTPYGWIYRPVSWQGLVLTVLAAVFCLHVLVVVDIHSHSVSDTFYGAFPYVIPAFGLFLWIASKTSERA